MQNFKNYLNEYGYGSGQGNHALASRSKEDEMEMARVSSINKKLTFRGWKFNPSIHASAQAHERRPDFTLDDWKVLHVRTWEKVDALASTTPRTGDYLFYSRSLQQGYVANVNFRNQEIRIITVLPKGRNRAKDGTNLVIVEGFEIEIIEAFDLD